MAQDDSNIRGWGRILSNPESQDRLLSAMKLADDIKRDPERVRIPDGIDIRHIFYFYVKDKEKRGMKGWVNGQEVFGVLSKNETAALLNGFITKEQAFMANKGIHNKVHEIADSLASNRLQEAKLLQENYDRLEKESQEPSRTSRLKI